MPSTAGGPQTLYDKILADHIVDEKLDGTILLYIGTLTQDCHSYTLLSCRLLLTCLCEKQTDILSMKSHHL